jgi:hypothetical protein
MCLEQGYDCRFACSMTEGNKKEDMSPQIRYRSEDANECGAPNIAEGGESILTGGDPSGKPDDWKYSFELVKIWQGTRGIAYLTSREVEDTQPGSPNPITVGIRARGTGASNCRRPYAYFLETSPPLILTILIALATSTGRSSYPQITVTAAFSSLLIYPFPLRNLTPSLLVLVPCGFHHIFWNLQRRLSIPATVGPL